MSRLQVSPHEFLQAVMAASGKRFTIDRQADPVDFLSWFLNALHADLTGGKRKKSSVVTRCFQARVRCVCKFQRCVFALILSVMAEVYGRFGLTRF